MLFPKKTGAKRSLEGTGLALFARQPPNACFAFACLASRKFWEKMVYTKSTHEEMGYAKDCDAKEKKRNMVMNNNYHK